MEYLEANFGRKQFMLEIWALSVLGSRKNALKRWVLFDLTWPDARHVISPEVASRPYHIHTPGWLFLHVCPDLCHNKVKNCLPGNSPHRGKFVMVTMGTRILSAWSRDLISPPTIFNGSLKPGMPMESHKKCGTTFCGKPVCA